MDTKNQRLDSVEKSATILLFDEDPDFRARMGRMAERKNVTILSSRTYQEFKREFISKQPDVIVIEANPDAEHRGEDIAHLTGQIPVLIISGNRVPRPPRKDGRKNDLVLTYLNKDAGVKTIIDQALTLAAQGDSANGGRSIADE